MKSEDLLMACFENGKEPDRAATFTYVNGNVSCFCNKCLKNWRPTV